MFRNTVFGRNLLKISHYHYQDQRNKSSFIEKFKQNQLPLWAGLSVIGFFQYRRIRSKHEQELNDALEQGKLIKIEEEVPWKVKRYS